MRSGGRSLAVLLAIGLSFGPAMTGGVRLATLAFSFTTLTEASPVIPADQQALIADTMEHDAWTVSDAQLQAVVAHETPAGAGGRVGDQP